MQKEEIRNLLFQTSYTTEDTFSYFDKIVEAIEQKTTIDKSYKRIIYNTIKFWKEFSFFDDPNAIFFLYNYMLYHSYFSKGEFKFEEIRDIFFDGKCIMGNRGCCRHISYFYYDLLSEYEKNFSDTSSILVDIYLPDKTLKTDFKNDLGKYGKNGKYYFEVNHQAVLVKKGDSILIHDSSNEDIILPQHLLEKEIPFTAKFLHYKEQLTIIPESLIDYRKKRIQELESLLQDMNEQPITNKKEILTTKRNVLRTCKKNKYLLHDYYLENKEDIDGIANILEKTTALKKEKRLLR